MNLIRRTFSTIPKRKPITITDNAWKQMNNIKIQTECHGFWFFADSGGCNGFNYELQPISKKDFDDLIKSNSNIKSRYKTTIVENKVNISSKTYSNNIIKCIIDPASEYLLLGTTIDFIEKDYWKGILNDKFTFTPDNNFASSCGCGISFSPKNIDV